ncbi:MAG TPA: hypothetical protein VFM34_05150 [Moraxellaceae bacterium]|nr:hypothetical protein [Moraxellaceae bacterium]
MLQQAQQILADSYSPEQKATRDFVTVPAYRVAEDKPAAFDFDTAQKRLLGMGALGLAEKLAGVQEAQRKAANGGIDESFFAPQFGYDASGNLVPLQFSNRGNAKKGALPDGVTGLAFPNEYKDTGGAIVALPKYGFGAPKPVAAKTQSPDSIVSNDPVTQARLARAKAEASKVGEVEGDLAGKEKKQIVNASDILDALDEAEPLIKKSTGSGIGKVVDMGAGVFGMSTEGAEAGDQLAILGSKLTMMQPRFEGPQSDADTKSYREAAGNLANTAIPRERRLASLSLIRRLNQKYANGPIQAPAASKPAPGKLNARQQMDAIKQAQAAAARGANKAVINQRLRDMGISFQVK